jgi:hypothetical protein
MGFIDDEKEKGEEMEMGKQISVFNLISSPSKGQKLGMEKKNKGQTYGFPSLPRTTPLGKLFVSGAGAGAGAEGAAMCVSRLSSLLAVLDGKEGRLGVLGNELKKRSIVFFFFVSAG